MKILCMPDLKNLVVSKRIFYSQAIVKEELYLSVPLQVFISLTVNNMIGSPEQCWSRISEAQRQPVSSPSLRCYTRLMEGEGAPMVGFMRGRAVTVEEATMNMSVTVNVTMKLGSVAIFFED